MTKLPYVTIYTDGSTRPTNPGAGGWAAILICNGKTRMMSGNVRYATNNNMEAMAVLRALETLRCPCAVEVCTDSMYVIYGITRLQMGKKALETNAEIWAAIRPYVLRHSIKLKKIAGHSGVRFNELCDIMAGEAAKGVTCDERGAVNVPPPAEAPKKRSAGTGKSTKRKVKRIPSFAGR